MGRLVVPQGRGAGEPFALRPWQREVQGALLTDPLLGLDFGPLAIFDEIDAADMRAVNALIGALGKREWARVLLVGSRVPGGETLDTLIDAAEGEPTWRVWDWDAPAGCAIDDEA